MVNKFECSIAWRCSFKFSMPNQGHHTFIFLMTKYVHSKYIVQCIKYVSYEICVSNKKYKLKLPSIFQNSLNFGKLKKLSFFSGSTQMAVTLVQYVCINLTWWVHCLDKASSLDEHVNT